MTGSAGDAEPPSTGARRTPQFGARQRDPVSRPVPRAPSAGVVALLLGLPAIGVALGEATGSGPGPAFAVLAVLGAVLPVFLVSRPGLWWVVPSPPLVGAPVSLVAEFLVNPPTVHGTKALGIWSAHWAIHTFPAIAAAQGAALIAVVIVLALRRGGPSGNRPRLGTQDRRTARRMDRGTGRV